MRHDVDYLHVANTLHVPRCNVWNLAQQVLVQWPGGATMQGGLRQQVVRAGQEMKNFLVDIFRESPAFTLRQISEELCRRLPNHCMAPGRLAHFPQKDGGYPNGKELCRNKAGTA